MAVTAILLCFVYPLISGYVVVPYINNAFSGAVSRLATDGASVLMSGSEKVAAIETEDFVIMGVMLICMCLLPLAMRYVNRVKERRVLSYMSGFNAGDDRGFYGSRGEEREQRLANWYMESIFGESKILRPCLVLTSLFLVAMMALCMTGGLFL